MMKPLWLAACILAAPLTAAAKGEKPVPPPPLPEILGQEVLLYVSIENPAQFRSKVSATALGKIWREEEVQAAAKELRKLAEREVARDSEDWAWLEAVRLLKHADLDRIDLALWTEAAPGDWPVFRMVAVCSGPGADECAEWIQGLLSRGRAGAPIPGGRTWNAGGVGFSMFEQAGCHIFTAVATGSGSGEKKALEGTYEKFRALLEEKTKTPAPLARSERFASVRKRLALRPGALFAFFNVASFKRLLAGDPDLARATDMYEPEFRFFARALGIGCVEAVGISLTPEGDGFRQHCVVETREPASGLLKAFAKSPKGPLRGFERLPADSLLATSAKVSWIDLAAAWKELRLGMDSEECLDFDEWIGSAQTESGVSVRGDLLAAFGEEFSISLGKPAGLIPIPPVTILVEVKDPKKAEECLAKIAAYAQTQGVKYAATPYGDRKLYSFGEGPGRGGRGGMGMAELGMIFQPTFAVTDTHLVASSGPQALKGLLASWKRPAAKGLAAQLEFSRAAARIPPEAVSATYVDLPQIVAIAYNTTLQLTGMASGGGLGGGAPDINLNALPSSETLTRHLFPAVVWTRTGPGAVEIEGWSPIGNLVPLDPLTLGAWAAMTASQVIGQERKQAVSTCRSNLSALHRAIQQQGAPARLADVVTNPNGWPNLRSLYCPLDPGGPTGILILKNEEVAVYLKEHPASYRYVKKNVGDSEEKVVLFEREARHRGQRHVLFANGATRLVSQEEFQKLAKEQGLLPAERPRTELTRELSAEIDAKIRELGANDFPVRAAAAARLRQIGPIAKDALKAALGHADPEIRVRAAEILESFDEE